jgi:RimJ/RimL family protein N-acetyltransferase
MTCPVLETERLVMRQHRLEDFAVHNAMWADPRSCRHFGGVARGEEDTWLRFLRNFGQWQLFGCGDWALEEKDGGRYLGAVGFRHARRAFEVPFRDAPEAGWIIAPDFHGRGLAREAMKAVMAWADAHMDAAESWCMIDPDNIASRKVAEGAGYRPAVTAGYKGRPMLTYLRPRGRPAA